MNKKNAFPLTPSTILRIILVGVFDMAVLSLIRQLLDDGNYPLSAILGVVIVIITLCYSQEKLRYYRWLGVSIAAATLFVLYPILYTIYLSTTNAGYGHILTKHEAVEFLERQQYVPASGQQYSWTAYRSLETSDDYLLWLQAEDNTTYLTGIGTATKPASIGVDGVGAADDKGIPLTIQGYQRLEKRDTVAIIDQLGEIAFGVAPDIIRITGLSAAATTQQRYHYDSDSDTLMDGETGLVYHPVEGVFETDDGQELPPGFRVGVGLHNFERFFASSALRGPLVRIISWNFAYAILSVFFGFALGLFIAVLFDTLPGKEIIRALLIIPYPIPALVSILIWRNLLNPDFGALVSLQESIFGTAPNWLTDPMWTRIAIIIINMWLSYPYFYIVSSGALQAIPTDMLDAAAVDGANAWQRFLKIILPLLLKIVSPLLVASFAFNFNNFNLIYIFNQGNPPIAGSPIPAGHTDILISFVYRLAFNSAISDYGLGASISIVLFLFVAAITWGQFRYTRVMEDQNA